MDRRRFLLTSLAGALAAPLAAEAQQVRKVYSDWPVHVTDPSPERAVEIAEVVYTRLTGRLVPE